MKEGIHPNYVEIGVSCSCGNQFQTRSTSGKPLQIEVCSNCHPFTPANKRSSIPLAVLNAFVRNTARKQLKHMASTKKAAPAAFFAF